VSSASCGRGLWRTLGRLGLWVGATYLGISFAGENHLVAFGPTADFDPADVDAGAAMVGFIFGAISGAILAVPQWVLLRSWGQRAPLWIPLSALGFGLAHMLHDSVPYRPLDLSWIILVDGVIIGVCQSVALRGVVPQGWLWVPTFAAAWFTGVTLAVALSPMVYGNPLAEHFLAFGAGGVVIGVITGLAVVSHIRIGGGPERGRSWLRWSS
jgi:hypothetical protein